MNYQVLFIILCISIKIFSVPAHYVSTTNITIGDPITYTIELPGIIDSFQPTFGSFELISSKKIEMPTSTVYEFGLKIFDVGSLLIPTQSILAINGYPSKQLNPIQIQVLSTLTPTKNQFNEIAPIFNLNYFDWLFIALVVGLVVIILCIIFYMWKKNNESINEKMEAISDPPIKTALNKIEKIDRFLTDDPFIIKQAYFELTEALCIFLTKVLRINVIDATTVEMRRLLVHRVNRDLFKDIISISETMDHYKFSEAPILNQSDCKSLIKQIKLIIIGISNDN